MLNLERLSNLTAELSTSLVRSLVWGRKERSRSRNVPAAVDAEWDDSPVQRAFLVAGLPIPADFAVSLIHEVGTRSMRVAIFCIGTDSAELGQEMVRLLESYGVKDIQLRPVGDRAQADDPDLLALAAHQQVLVLAGSDPYLMRELLADTLCQRALEQHLSKGGIVVGLGGGAGALGERMIAASDDAPTSVSPGLRLLPRLIVSCEGQPRSGQSGLLHAMGTEMGARYLGVALDGPTALVIHGTEARVLGEGSVTFLDGRDSSCEPEDALSERRGTPIPLGPAPICGLKVHVLVAGYGLNLKTRRSLGPATPANVRVPRAAGS